MLSACDHHEVQYQEILKKDNPFRASLEYSWRLLCALDVGGPSMDSASTHWLFKHLSILLVCYHHEVFKGPEKAILSMLLGDYSWKWVCWLLTDILMDWASTNWLF